MLRLSRSYPEMVGRDKLLAFYSQNRPAMFVANHCSWMDIPFVGATVGWRNYKLVSKKELGIVPILGDAIRVGGNIMVDRTDRKSQLKTLKQGINYLKKVCNRKILVRVCELVCRYGRLTSSCALCPPSPTAAGRNSPVHLS